MNTVGSFRCECDPGYIYDETSHQVMGVNVMIPMLWSMFGIKIPT
jgi:hypothetical protein